MKKLKFNRRTLLKGLMAGATVSVGLPLLNVFLDDNGQAMASGDAIATRFGIFFWGNGVLPDKWVPKDTGAGFTLSEQLEPLAGVRDHITVVSGCEVKTGNAISHASGAAGILSGAPLIVESETNNTFSAPSVDQIMAAEIGQQTRFASLEFGAEPGSGRSYNGPHSKNPPESDPYKLFERVFGGGFRAPGEDGQVDPKIGLRRSVLDSLLDDIKDVEKQVGHQDKVRLEQHFSSIRALETRLAKLEEDPPQRAACAKPGAPEMSYPRIDGRPQLGAKNRAMSEILVMALACDQTRVFANYITKDVNNLLFAGAEAGHHQLTHDEPGDQPQVNKIVKELMAHYATFIDTLRAIPEGDGTLLDNCIVFGTSEISFGRTHSLDEFPIVLAGSGGGAIKTGIHHRSLSKDNTSDVMFTCMRAAGAKVTSFGQGDGETTKTMTAIEV